MTVWRCLFGQELALEQETGEALVHSCLFSLWLRHRKMNIEVTSDPGTRSAAMQDIPESTTAPRSPAHGSQAVLAGDVAAG